MNLSIVIVNWNTRELLLKCLASVFETIRSLSFEVWVVDNGSTDGSAEAAVEQFPGIRIIRNAHNLGFAAANNQALQQAGGRYALLLNSDATLTEGAVQKLFDFMEHTREAAMVCGQLLNPDGSRQNSIANFPSLASLLTNETVLRLLFPRRYPSKLRRLTTPIEVDSGIGACLMVRKEAMDAVGLLDERFFFFFEETDWAKRMREAGWKVYFVPDAYIFHAQGQSVGHGALGRIFFYRSRYLYFRKWFPTSYPLFYTAVVLRLVMNTLLSGLGVLLTAFCLRGLKRQLFVYLELLRWHLRGCPEQ